MLPGRRTGYFAAPKPGTKAPNREITGNFARRRHTRRVYRFRRRILLVDLDENMAPVVTSDEKLLNVSDLPTSAVRLRSADHLADALPVKRSPSNRRVDWRRAGYVRSQRRKGDSKARKAANSSASPRCQQDISGRLWMMSSAGHRMRPLSTPPFLRRLRRNRQLREARTAPPER
jgi:hypothetical protein